MNGLQTALLLGAMTGLFIVKPFTGGRMKLFSTHPPMEERIRRLRTSGRP